MAANFTIDVAYFRLSEELQPYFTALYAFDIRCPPGERIVDCLHPEWAAMRFANGPPPLGRVGPGELERQWPFVASGPTSRPTHFGITAGKIWGLGLQPAGWAKFAEGPARAVTNRTVDGMSHPAFQLFRPILALVQDEQASAEAIARRINDVLVPHLGRPSAQQDRILACHRAIRDPDVANVADLAGRIGVGTRALERLCGRYFGFPPKLLLRRQRFLRSLAQFMLGGKLNWSRAIDGQYHDQAQFVKDFRSFMGMTPSEYAERPHPILDRIMAQRMADAGAAAVTDLPTVLRYGGGRDPGD